MASHPHRLLKSLLPWTCWSHMPGYVSWLIVIEGSGRQRWLSLCLFHLRLKLFWVFLLVPALLEDSVIWNASPNSKFSARSTYELAMNLCEQSERGCISNDGVIKKFWRKIWSLQVPNKVKHFAWRACKISSLVFLTLRREVFWWMIGVSNVVRRGSLRVNCFGAVVLLLKCGSYLLYLSLA